MENIQYYEFINNLYLKYGIPTYDLNIFGIRDEAKQNEDIWNDWIGYFIPNKEIHFYRGTTDPGIYWTINPMDPAGAAHLCLGYHKDIWKIDKHRGEYTALCNKWLCRNVRVWRDKNKDTTYEKDIDPIQSGIFGINLHRADALQLITKIGKYSAGCQVIRNPESFNALIELSQKSNQRRFSYFLFDKSQIPFFNELT
jgi:hypothetical protein